MAAIDIESLRQSVAEELRIPVDKVTDDADFIDDLNVDSLGVVELALGLERKFGLVIPDEDLKDIRSLRNLVDYAAAHETVGA